MSENNKYGQQLVAGLKPAIELPEMGKVFQDTTQGLASKLADLIKTTFGIPEVDNLIITPKLARNSVGISDVSATIFFVTDKGGKNIYYRGKGGNNQAQNGRISMVNMNGGGAGTGRYNTSDEFRSVMMPLCKTNEKGNAVMDIRSVERFNNVASLELDFSALMCLALGIDPKDNYDFIILTMTPIPNTDNFSMTFMKHISSAGDHKGKASGINYARIAQDLFNRSNNGGGRNNGNNGGGRGY